MIVTERRGVTIIMIIIIVLIIINFEYNNSPK